MSLPKTGESKKMVGIKSNYIAEQLMPAVMNGNPIAHQPSYGNVNAKQDWADEFAKLSGEAFNAVFTEIIKQANEALSSKANTDSIQSLVDNFNKEIKAVVNNLANKSSSIELRGHLIWFKEALYSDTQKASYRKLNAEIAAVVLAFEYSKLLPEYCPASVEYFIAETFYSSNSKCDEISTFQEILDYLVIHKEKLKPYFVKYIDVKPGRITLLQYVGFLINGLLSKEGFQESTGLSFASEISWSNLSIWLYREFQANKLITKK